MAVERVRQGLGTLIDLSWLSRREIERRLAEQGCGLDLNRLLGGKAALKLHQVLDVLRVLDVHPWELFRLTFKEPERRSPLLERVQALFAPARPPSAVPPCRAAEKELEELCRRLEKLEQLIAQIEVRAK
jgi:hypothetical protein